MSCILALDEGTTSARALVFNPEGKILAVAQREFRQIFPADGWVEHDPEEIWACQAAVAGEAVSRAGLRPSDVAAVGIANQRETVVIWDRETGRPVHNAIVWQDRRTAPACARLRADGREPWIRERTGLLLDPYFSATKVAWILDRDPGLRRRAEAGGLAFGTVDGWLVWKLSGGRAHVTDVTNASRTMLCDLRSGGWDAELAALFRIPETMLPRIVPSSGPVAEARALPGLESVPVCGIAGDQQAALFGEMCVRPGLTKNTYGTGCFMLRNTGTVPVASRNRLLTTAAWRLQGRTDYALEGSVFTGGSAVQWLRDGLGLIRSAPEVEALAGSVPDNGGVYMVPAFSGLGAPHWDPHARGLIVGVTRATTAGHLARAALEGIAYQVADLADAMREDAGTPPEELRVDGGAARNDLLMQFQADLLGVPVVRPAVTETTALGAAYLAGLGVGIWKDPEEISGRWRAERRFEPAMPRDRVDALRGRWRRARERAAGWAEERE